MLGAWRRVGLRTGWRVVDLGAGPGTERPAIVARRRQIGHWEIDTVQGSTRVCLVTAVERVTGYALIGKFGACTTEALVARLTQLLRDQRHPVRTITADNGPEMTGCRYLERALQTRFYFTQPYSAWQRGSIEHLIGLIRRVYPKGTDFTHATQHGCTRLARQFISVLAAALPFAPRRSVMNDRWRTSNLVIQATLGALLGQDGAGLPFPRCHASLGLDDRPGGSPT